MAPFDSVAGSDPRGRADGHCPDTAPLPQQAATLEIQWFGVVTQSSADHRYVQGQLERSKKPVFVRGLDPAHNHYLKDLFKSAAMQASIREGPFREFYQTLVDKGMRPEMARLTLARKIAVITL